MEYVIYAGLLLVSVCGSVMVGILKDEAAAWMPVLADKIVKIAVARAPSALKEQYSSEWPAHIAEYPGRLSQLIQAFGCLSAAGRSKPWSYVRFLRYMVATMMVLSLFGSLAVSGSVMKWIYLGDLTKARNAAIGLAVILTMWWFYYLISAFILKHVFKASILQERI